MNLNPDFLNFSIKFLVFALQQKFWKLTRKNHLLELFALWHSFVAIEIVKTDHFLRAEKRLK